MSVSGNKTRNLKKSLFIGIIVAAVLSVTGLAAQQNLKTETDASTRPICMTVNEYVRALEFEVKIPSSLPEGYSLQCQKAELFQAFLIYAPNALSTSDMEKSVTQDQAILVVVNDETMSGAVQPAAPEERVKEDTRLITPELMQEMKARYLTLNGNPAWVREAGDYGTQTVQYANGTIISTESRHEPARLHLYIGDIDYVIIGDRTSADLIRLAESIK